jgi:hypothetical protein
VPVRVGSAFPTGRRGQRGQALVETALVVPLVLLLVFGVIGVGRLTRAQMAVSAVAREAARAGALASTAGEAGEWGMSRGQEVAAGYALGNGSLDLRVEPGAFDRGGQVRASARYTVELEDLPLMNWVRVPVAGSHVERVDLYRSRWAPETGR